MQSCSIIIQGEGKGHFSQAETTMDILAQQGIEFHRVYLSRSFFRTTPAYFYSELNLPIVTYFSPNFIRSSDQKGIRILPSILLNILLSPIYLFEVMRIGVLMISDRSKIIINFYDPVGAMAAKLFKRGAKKIIIAHHFYMMHPDFLHPHGMGKSRLWLYRMNRIMYRSADIVLALTFRKAKDIGKLKSIPPLVSERIRKQDYSPGERDLAYFLNQGFASEIIEFYRVNPEHSLDLFTDLKPAEDIPDNVTVHPPSREIFIEAMLHCRRIICTAGFDLVAEAFYLGIPVLLIPSLNHYEQYCNALDAARTGMAFHLDSIEDLDVTDFSPQRNKQFREWADQIDQSIRTIYLS